MRVVFLSAQNFNLVALSVLHRLPGQNFRFLIQPETRLLDFFQRAAIDERLGNRGRVAVGFGCDDKGDSLLRHRTVHKIVKRGVAQSKTLVSVSLVSAHYGDVVGLRVLDLFENQRGRLHDGKKGNRVKRLVFEISRDGNALVRAGCGNRNHVVACRSRREVDCLDRRVAGLVHSGKTVGALHLQAVGHACGNAARNPFGGHADLGSGKSRLGSRRPESKQSGVFGEHRVLRVARGEHFGAVVHAYPPAAEGVAAADGLLHVYQSAAYCHCGGDCRSAVVVEVKRHRKLRLSRFTLRPERIERRVGGYYLRVEQKRHGVRAVLVPADKGISVADGFRGTGESSAVEHVDRRDGAASRRIESDSVRKLFQKAKLRARIFKRNHFVAERGGQVRFVPSEIEHQLCSRQGVFARKVFAHNPEGKAIAGSQSYLILDSLVVVVVNSRFGPRNQILIFRLGFAGCQHRKGERRYEHNQQDIKPSLDFHKSSSDLNFPQPRRTIRPVRVRKMLFDNSSNTGEFSQICHILSFCRKIQKNVVISCVIASMISSISPNVK